MRPGLFARAISIPNSRSIPSGQVEVRLSAVLPLIALQIINDALRKSREFIAEISGATAISISSMAIAIAGGQSLAFAAALWTVFVGRFIPTVIYVRNRLLLEKGKRYSRTIRLSLTLLLRLSLPG
jgi:hypothetical protein